MSDPLRKLIASLGPEKRALLADLLRPAAEPIAIVGMACRFPGASSPEALFRLLHGGVDAITKVPSSRWDVDALLARDPSMAPASWGGFLDDVDRFEPGVFGISPREALHLDPQQRLMLEVVWEALEDAGLPLERVAGTATGVFVGACSAEYGQICARDPRALGPHTGPGICNNMLAGRVSYVFDLRGPSLVVDTACSSSLVAVHLACESLRRKESAIAIAGGVNLVLTAEGTLIAHSMQLLAADGRCKPFDARADGIARGEGCGVVVMKRLADALADGDRVLAVVRGSATNQDGRSNGLTAPSGAAQRDVITRALAEAGASPADVAYVETHGTGTSLGDPIEVEALDDVLGRGRDAGARCVLGSAKANLGHTEGAAGIAGVLKVVLSIAHQSIPPQIHFRRLNPHIALEGRPFVVPTEPVAWPVDGARRIAGVSAFGWSGTNAHAVIEEPPAPAPIDARPADDGAPKILPLSAQSPAALRALADRWSRFLDEEGGAIDLRDVAYTAGARRSHHKIRHAVVGATHAELAAALRDLAGDERPFAAEAPPTAVDRVVFVFPGQGSQWRGMGRTLLAEPAFRASLEACDAALREVAGWSVIDMLGSDDAEARWKEVDVIQPLLFTMQVSLAALWRSWGIEPDAVIGHSLGEIAAAHVAGALDLSDAARVIALRSQLVRTTSGRGRMALAELSMAEAQELVAGFGKRLSVAASNGPRTVLLSGEPSAVESALEGLRARDVFCRYVDVDYASHSEHMAPLAGDLRARLASIRPRAARVPIYSTVTAEPITGESMGAEYWVENLREPVLFHPALERLIKDGRDVFLEVSAHPVLVPSIEATLAAGGRAGAVLASTRRDHDERRSMLASLAALYARGRQVDWARHAAHGGRVVSLPTYAWQKERYWPATSHARSRGFAPGAGLLAGEPLALHTGARAWETDVSLAALPWLDDHRVGGAVVFPGAAYVELALEASRDAFGAGGRVVEEIAFEQMLEIPADGSKVVQIVVTPGGEAGDAFAIASEAAGAWTVHARGVLRARDDEARRVSTSELRARCPDPLAPEDFYEGARLAGVDFGPAFRRLEEIAVGKGEAIARVRIDEATARVAAACEVDPTLLDACFQVLGCAMSTTASGSFLPVAIASVAVGRARPRGAVWAHASIAPAADGAGPRGDLLLFAEDGEVLLEVRGLQLQRVGAARETVDEWLYAIDWEAKPLPPRPARERATWIVLGDDPLTGALAATLEEGGDRCVLVGTAAESPRDVGGRERLDLTDGEQVARVVRGLVRDAEPKCRGVLFVPAPSADGAAKIEETSGCVAALHVVRALTGEALPGAPRLWLVTRASQPIGGGAVSIGHAPLWGLGKTIAQEHPELRCACVDVGSEPSPGEVDALADEIRSELDENQLAIRGNDRYVARLVHWAPPPPKVDAAGARPYRVTSEGAAPLARRAPNAGEVEIAVAFAGVDRAAKRARACAGRIARAGEGALGLAEGDEVVALGDLEIATHVVIDARAVVRRPEQVAPAIAAAALPLVVAAHHAAAALAGVPAGELVASIAREAPARCAAMIDAAAKTIAPRVIGASALSAASNEPALVVTLDDPAVAIASDASSVPVAGDATYLVTGGLGGLGLVVARWLVARGARHLALAGRSDPSPEVRAVLESLAAEGARVATIRCDVSDAGDVARMLARVGDEMPPLRGVVHAAGVLDDGVAAHLDAARFARVMGPKAGGAWNLHAQTRDLDFFVLFSSVASALGSAGQANYAAANAYLDALAHARRAAGLPATSVNWGAWRGVGLAAAQDNRGERLARRGFLGLSPAEGVAALERIVAAAPAQVTAMRLRLRDLRDLPITAFPIFARLLKELGDQRASEGKLRAELEALATVERRYRLETYVRREIAQILRLSPAAVDVAAPLSALGFDSLMALEFRNRLDLGLALRLSATALWAHRSIEDLVPYLAEQMHLALDDGPASGDGAPVEEAPIFTTADTLADDEVEAALLAKLDSLENGEMDHV